MPSIWKNQRFNRFFAAFAIGNLGDWFDIFALQLIFVREFNASPVTMGFLALLYFIPGVILGPLVGVLADRYSRRNLMILTDSVSAILTLGIFFSTGIYSAMLFLLLRSSIASLNPPTQQGYIANVVSGEQLLKASSYVGVVFQMAKMLGPLVGAAILSFAEPRDCIALNVLSFVFSAAVLWTLPKDKMMITAKKVAHNWLHDFIRDLQDGLVYVKNHSVLRNVLGIVFVWYLCGMLRNSQLAVFLKHLLPNESRALGYILGLDAFGAAVISFWLARKKSMLYYGGYFAIGFFLIAAGVLGIALYNPTWPRIVLYFAALVLGFGSGVASVVYGYLRKKEPNLEQVGRVYGINSTVQNIAMAIGTVVGGFLVAGFGVREVFITLAALFLVLGLLSFKLPKSV